MMLHARCLAIAVVALSLLSAMASRVGAVQKYRVTDLGLGFEPKAMNDHGQIVGEWIKPGAAHATAWLVDGCSQSPIEQAGMGEVRPQAINNHGLVVGWAESGNDTPRAFAWDAKAGWRFLDSPSDDKSSVAYDVNDSGVVAGWFGAAAARDAAGNLIPVGQLGASGADAMAINARGDVVGFSGVGDGTTHRAFLWRDGVIRDLNVAAHAPDGKTDFECAYDVNIHGTAVGIAAAYPLDNFTPSAGFGFVAEPGNNGQPGRVEIVPDAGLFAVNDAGMAAGWMRLAGGTPEDVLSAAAIYRESVLTNLNDLLVAEAEFFVGYAMDVNNRGQILATGWRGARPESGPVNGLLLTPVPEPSGILLAVLALAVLVVRTRGRRD